MQVWIAAHIDCPERGVYLQKLLRDLPKFDQISTIRVSQSGVEICTELDPKIQYHYHSVAPKLQFEHYHYLYTTHSGAPDTRIVFMDDDDTLLAQFFEYAQGIPSGIAMQIEVYESDPDLDHVLGLFTAEDIRKAVSVFSTGQRNKFPPENGAPVLLRVDHSGSWTTFETLHDFFENRIYGYMTDLQFWEYLCEHCGAQVSAGPVAVARRWTSHPFWQQQFMKST